MAGFEGNPLDDGYGARFGGQLPEADISGFAVYGGTPADRETLEADDPNLKDQLRRQLQDSLDGYGEGTFTERPSDCSIGKTPFDALLGEDKG